MHPACKMYTAKGPALFFSHRSNVVIDYQGEIIASIIHADHHPLNITNTTLYRSAHLCVSRVSKACLKIVADSECRVYKALRLTKEKKEVHDEYVCGVVNKEGDFGLDANQIALQQ